MTWFLAVLAVLAILVFLTFGRPKKKTRTPETPFPDAWKKLLAEEVLFYNHLNSQQQSDFEKRVHTFILNCKITGIETGVSDKDKVLIGSSAIIPIFNFPDWAYPNIDEVLLYPEQFNEGFSTDGENRTILGMVGTGYMNGKMILSKKSLYHGFKNKTDKQNTAVHEFIHLIDKADGSIDGIPEVLMDKAFILPWVDLIEKKMSEIQKGSANINPYATTNHAEFLAVVGEYFFERPKLLKRKHPELYKRMESIFIKKEAIK